MRLIVVLGACVSIVAFSCNKEATVNGKVLLQGHLYMIDPNGTGLPTPVPGQAVYLNDKRDTPSYIFSIVTDSLGQYAIPSLEKDDHYILFTRWIQNNVLYAGAIAIEPTTQTQPITLNLNAYPDYANGIALTFEDQFGGMLSNQPFRLYTSSVFAAVDSSRYAFVDTMADMNGHFDIYNVVPNTYYLVASDTVTKTPLTIIQASQPPLVVGQTNITAVTVKLQ
jgi:hypothetical protein